jgi:hypothetical protein
LHIRGHYEQITRHFHNDLGPATVLGSNGDILKFNYRQGKRFGLAVYHWQDGTIENSVYNEEGLHSGPAKLTWYFKVFPVSL